MVFPVSLVKITTMKTTRTQISYVNRSNSTTSEQIRCSFKIMTQSFKKLGYKTKKLNKYVFPSRLVDLPFVEKELPLAIFGANYVGTLSSFLKAFCNLLDLILTNIFISKFYNALQF